MSICVCVYICMHIHTIDSEGWQNTVKSNQKIEPPKFASIQLFLSYKNGN